MDIIQDAVLKAVKDEGQSKLLAKAILAWFSELENGNESINDEEAVKRRLSLLWEKTDVVYDGSQSEVSDED